MSEGWDRMCAMSGGAVNRPSQPVPLHPLGHRHDPAAEGPRLLGVGARRLLVQGPGQGVASEHYLDWAPSGRPTVPRHLGGLLLILLAWAVGTVAVGIALRAPAGQLGRAGPSSPAGQLAFVCSSFALGFLAVPAVVRGVLRRPGWSVLVPHWPGRARDFLVGAGIAATAGLAVDLLVTPIAPLHRGDFDPATWLPLAAVGIVGFLVQAGFEELLFRGYLTQAVASRSRRSAVVIGVPAVVFCLPHWGNLDPYAGNPFQLVPFLLLGLTLGWAAWYSGSLWLPFGLHWANNLYATVAVTSTGDVLPTGAPLTRDLASLPLTVVIASTAAQCAVSVIAIRLVCPRGRWVRARDRPEGGQ